MELAFMDIYLKTGVSQLLKHRLDVLLMLF
jgi:hypothetical protein